MLSRIIMVMKHGYPISPQNQSNSRWTTVPSRSKPNKCCQSTRLWQRCSGNGAVFCWWTLYYKEQRSTQVLTVQLYGSAEDHKRRGRLSKGTLLLRDKARPHTSRTTRDLIKSFGWGSFGPSNIQPQPCSKRFLPFPVPQTVLVRSASVTKK
ncbi:hypothetical protein TNCV_2769091 [Trichonephila clavipes]|nr:hypothetical protein TNCV_2769091 [Trichonephila clavipes]